MITKRSRTKFAWIVLATALVTTICLGAQTAPSDQDAAKTPPAPPDYAARTDTRPEPLPSQPLLIGPAGSIVKDPAFGSRILRVTDGDILPGKKGFSFVTPAAAWVNTWNQTSSRFYVMSRGGSRPVFNFDPVQMSARYSGLDLSESLQWGEAAFSYTDPDVIYGIGYAGGHVRLQKYDFARRRAADAADPARCIKMQPGWGAMDLSVGGESPRLATALGPQQDRDLIVYVHDLKLGCRWYNTLTGEVGGDWGTRGIVSTPVRSAGIHALEISPSGDYVYISGDGVNGFWRVESTEVSLCTEMCGGHWVMGYSHFINNAASHDDAESVLRPFSDVKSLTQLISSFPPGPAWGADRHYSWNNDSPYDTAPVCASTYLNPDSPRGAAAFKAQPGLVKTGVPIERAWEDEVVCIQTEGKGSKVWRFAHTFSAATNGFWSEPRGNVSQDGRFYMFTSDWLSTLGKDPQVPLHRVDVFIVELK